MKPNDLINGLFEVVGAATCWLNVAKIARDRCVRGVYWPLSLFFTAWGAWNLWYYPSLGQPLSFWGALMMVLANGAWVVLAARYSKRDPT